MIQKMSVDLTRDDKSRINIFWPRYSGFHIKTLQRWDKGITLKIVGKSDCSKKRSFKSVFSSDDSIHLCCRFNSNTHGNTSRSQCSSWPNVQRPSTDFAILGTKLLLSNPKCTVSSSTMNAPDSCNYIQPGRALTLFCSFELPRRCTSQRFHEPFFHHIRPNINTLW